MTTIDTLTTDQIRTLQRGAARAGDLAMVAICRLASGDEEEATQGQIAAAQAAVVAALRDAEAA